MTRKIKWYYCPSCDKNITQMQTTPPDISFSPMSVTPIARDGKRCRKCGELVEKKEKYF